MSSDDGFRIRLATPDDAELVAELSARLFDQTFGPENTRENMQLHLATSYSARIQRVELCDVDRSVWLATDEMNRAIGYAMLRRGSRGDGVTFREPAEVQRIYVDRTWHGRRVGHGLMTACFAEARRLGCDGVWLCVWEYNPRAIAFYERFGFHAVGRASFTLGHDVQHDFVLARAID